jgi:Holliday junction resolvasome RuvABC endonuclease subunit
MSKLVVVGIDPAMSNLGLARAEVDIHTLEWTITNVHLVSTEGAKKAEAKVVRKSSDDLRRAKELRAGLADYIKGAGMAVGEVPTGTQSARGSLGNGMSIMLLAGLPCPLIEVSPTEVKVASVGHKHATKDEVIQWAVAKWPNAGWITKTVKGKVSLTAANEHMADACAAIAASFRTDEFHRSMAMLRAASGVGVAA